jgi:hypothetical protein
MTIQPGKYRHYKGKEYQVIGVGRHSETLEKLVVYQGLYNSNEFGDRPIWVRSVSEFTEIVTVDGRKIQRFMYLGE